MNKYTEGQVLNPDDPRRNIPNTVQELVGVLDTVNNIATDILVRVRGTGAVGSEKTASPPPSSLFDEVLDARNRAEQIRQQLQELSSFL